MNASIERAARVLLVLCTLSLAGCGSLVRDVLGVPRSPTAVNVRCGQGDESQAPPTPDQEP